MTRVQDDPGHVFYGPVRRLWVVFQTLIPDKYAYADEEYVEKWGEPWDDTLTRWLAAHEGGQVTYLMRALTRRMLQIVEP